MLIIYCSLTCLKKLIIYLSMLLRESRKKGNGHFPPIQNHAKEGVYSKVYARSEENVAASHIAEVTLESCCAVITYGGMV